MSGAGDVNGDGYADVIVGADSYDNGETGEGAAFVFLGSSSGLVGTSPATAAAVLESNQAGARLGSSVSDAGDVNGDGYADVIIGMPSYANGEYSEGAAALFLGTSAGIQVNPQLRKSSNSPIAAPGISIGSSDLRLQLLAHDLLKTRSAVRLEWEIKPYGIPL